MLGMNYQRQLAEALRALHNPPSGLDTPVRYACPQCTGRPDLICAVCSSTGEVDLEQLHRYQAEWNAAVARGEEPRWSR